MAIAWCSPSPRFQNPPKSKEEVTGNQEEEEDENVQQLEDCARAYRCLEDCLVKSDRNWSACRNEVKVLKECHDAKAKKQSTLKTVAQISCGCCLVVDKLTRIMSAHPLQCVQIISAETRRPRD